MHLLPLALDLDPYSFACDGPLFGIPHGANVLTNAPFLLLGLGGLLRLARARDSSGPRGNRTGLWLSVALLAFGSGAYHLWLTPLTLAADRVCISAILAFVVAETWAVVEPTRRSPRVTLVLLAVTEGSIALWLLGATSWPYGVLQVVGGVALIALAVRGARTGRLSGVARRALTLFIVCYALAKVAEVLDEPICRWTGGFAGHPLKHLLAGAGIAALLPWLARPAEAPLPGAPPRSRPARPPAPGSSRS